MNPVGAGGAKEMVMLTLPDEDDTDAAQYEPGTSELPQAFAKKGKNGKSGLQVSLDKCTLGPQESNKDAMQFEEDEPAGKYVLNLARIFDQVVLRSLVRLTLERKGGFKAGVTMDGKKALKRLIFRLDSVTFMQEIVWDFSPHIALLVQESPFRSTSLSTSKHRNRAFSSSRSTHTRHRYWRQTTKSSRL